MYLANDVIQNSKKKGPEYGKEFGSVLKKAFDIVGKTMIQDKTKKSMNRLLEVWEERGVYSKSQILEFRRAFRKYLLKWFLLNTLTIEMAIGHFRPIGDRFAVAYVL